MAEGAPKELKLTVSYHQSGRYTLVVKGDRVGSDVGGNLIGNLDKGEFYRAVAREIAERCAQGIRIRYEDTTLDRPSN